MTWSGQRAVAFISLEFISAAERALLPHTSLNFAEGRRSRIFICSLKPQHRCGPASEPAAGQHYRQPVGNMTF